VPTSTSVAVQLIHGAAKTNMMFELTMHVSGLPPTSKPFEVAELAIARRHSEV
jgi:hypothetical protein